MAAIDEPFDPDDEYDPVEAAAAFPHALTNTGDLVPELTEIPGDRWEEVLRPLEPDLRAVAAARLRPDRALAAEAILLRLEDEDEERRLRALTESAPPDVAPPARRPYVRLEPKQVSFRLSEAEHRRLQRAARAYGTTGARLARMLTIRGVRRALRDP